MPQKKGWLTVQVREEVKNNLLELYNKDKKRPSNQKFTAYLDLMLKNTIEFNKQITEYGPFLEFNSAIDNHIAIQKRKNYNVTFVRKLIVYILDFVLPCPKFIKL